MSIPSSIFLSLIFPTAERGHHEPVRRGFSPLDPAVPSDLSATPGTADIAGPKDKDGLEGTGGDPGAGPRAWPNSKLYAGARAAVWTEREAGVRTEVDGKVFTETGIMTGTSVWAEVGAEWRPGDTERSMPRDPAAWLGQQWNGQTRGMGQRDQTAFSSVPTMLPETVELQAPALGKPLGLLSKAAWTRSSSSSSSKSSSSTTKASSLPSSSSSSSPASNRESQTAASDNVSLAVLNSNFTTNSSSSSSSLGMCCSVF